MGKPGAFLLVPQEVDDSELLMGAQRRFEERDRDGWERLGSCKQGLLDMLRENKNDWPDIAQPALEAAPVQDMGIWPFYGIPKLERWASADKRVIIVGDAAHAISPTAGQGVNQTFEDIDMLALLISKLSLGAPLRKALDFWQTYRQEKVDKVLDLTKQMNAKRLPPAEQAKLPPGAIWSDKGKTRGEGGRWLYEPELHQQVDSWLAEQNGLKQLRQALGYFGYDRQDYECVCTSAMRRLTQGLTRHFLTARQTCVDYNRIDAWNAVSRKTVGGTSTSAVTKTHATSLRNKT